MIYGTYRSIDVVGEKALQNGTGPWPHNTTPEKSGLYLPSFGRRKSLDRWPVLLIYSHVVNILWLVPNHEMLMIVERNGKSP